MDGAPSTRVLNDLVGAGLVKVITVDHSTVEVMP
jgi:hypothetical protein